MIIVGFSRKTSKILPRFFCKHFKHCAPVIVLPGGQMIMYQFVRYRHIEKIHLRMRDIKLLGASGWEFVYMPGDARTDAKLMRAKTCVGLTRCVTGVGARAITPDDMYIACIMHTHN